MFAEIVVTGYSDGTEEPDPRQLGERRAKIVRDYRVAKGLDWRRVFWEAGALSPNRRVLIEASGRVPKPPTKRPPADTGV